MNALHPRVRARWGLVVATIATVVGVVVAAIDRFLFSLSPVLGPALAGFLLALGAGYVLLLYRNWRYWLDEDALELERGVLTKVDTAVPFVRIQHVDTQRDPLDRGLGLASVVVYTAGSRGADVTIPGLRPDQARDLRNRLRDLAIESEPEDAV